MKLNPTKCRFVVASEEFLGYLVTFRGIKANPKQINALIEMASPKNKREVQRLTGRVAALNRFISRSTDKCLPFYDVLRGNKKFEWSEECKNAFQQLKRYLASPPSPRKTSGGGTFVLVHRCISNSCERGANQGRTRRTETYFLYQQNLAGCRI